MLLVFVLLFGMYGCGSISPTNKSPEVYFKIIIDDKLDGRLNYIYNTDSTSVICTGHKTKLSTSFSFLIYSISDNEFLSDEITNVETVKWIDDFNVGYRYMAGTVLHNEQKQPLTIIKIKPTK